jgi:hypothetical protein
MRPLEARAAVGDGGAGWTITSQSGNRAGGGSRVGGSDRPHEDHGSNWIVGMIHIDRDQVLCRSHLQARAASPLLRPVSLDRLGLFRRRLVRRIFGIFHGMRIPTKPAGRSNRKPATDSDFKPAHLASASADRCDDVLPGAVGQAGLDLDLRKSSSGGG